MRTVTVNVDHFGESAAHVVEALLNQSTNNRARKLAFNAIVRFAKATHTVLKSSKVLHIALGVNASGGQHLIFMCDEAASAGKAIAETAKGENI